MKRDISHNCGNLKQKKTTITPLTEIQKKLHLNVCHVAFVH